MLKRSNIANEKLYETHVEHILPAAITTIITKIITTLPEIAKLRKAILTRTNGTAITLSKT